MDGSAMFTPDIMKGARKELKMDITNAAFF
jgi:hypothetical protein